MTDLNLRWLFLGIVTGRCCILETYPEELKARMQEHRLEASAFLSWID